MPLDFSLFQCHYTWRIYGVSHLHQSSLIQSTYEAIKICTYVALFSPLYCIAVWLFCFPCGCTNSEKYLEGGNELKILGPALSGSLDQMSFRGSFQPKLFSDVYVCVHV